MDQNWDVRIWLGNNWQNFRLPRFTTRSYIAKNVDGDYIVLTHTAYKSMSLHKRNGIARTV